MRLPIKPLKLQPHVFICFLIMSIVPAYANEDTIKAWEGFNAGLGFSYLDVASDIDYPNAIASDPSDYEDGIHLSLEYMAPLGHKALVGAELMVSHNKGAAEDSARYNGANLHLANWRVGVDHSTRIMGKLAVAARPKTLLYAGVGIEKVSFSFTQDVVSSGATFQHADKLNGHVLAAGIDQIVSDKMSLRIEVSHTDIDRQLYQNGQFDTPVWINPDIRTARVSVRYHF